MLRSELISAARRVRQAIRRPSMLELFRSRDEQISIDQILETFRDWIKAQETFGVAEERVLDCLGLLELTQISYWNQLIVATTAGGSDTPSSSGFANLRTLLRAADTQIPKLVSLLKADADTSLERDEASDASKMTLLLPEQPEELSTPHRLIEALESVVHFYDGLATVSGPSRTDLALVSCDSGSAKSFEFVGDPKIIEKVKNTILSLWNRLIYFKNQHYIEKIDWAARSLPILDAISELFNKGKLTPQQRDTLRSKITAAAVKFARSGAIIPEIEKNSHFDPSALLMAAPGFLLKWPAEAGGPGAKRVRDAQSAQDADAGLGAPSGADASEMAAILPLGKTSAAA